MSKYLIVNTIFFQLKKKLREEKEKKDDQQQVWTCRSSTRMEEITNAQHITAMLYYNIIILIIN